jgi:hypothetical protein
MKVSQKTSINTTDEDCKTMKSCADAGYANTKVLEELYDEGPKVIVPIKKTKNRACIWTFKEESRGKFIFAKRIRRSESRICAIIDEL